MLEHEDTQGFTCHSSVQTTQRRLELAFYCVYRSNAVVTPTCTMIPTRSHAERLGKQTNSIIAETPDRRQRLLTMEGPHVELWTFPRCFPPRDVY